MENNGDIFFPFAVVILCASPIKVREILLAAEGLGLMDRGEYVFFNVELFARWELARRDFGLSFPPLNRASCSSVFPVPSLPSRRCCIGRVPLDAINVLRLMG